MNRRARLFTVAVVVAVIASGCAFLTRASVLQQPGQGDLQSTGGMVTPDGRYVLFDSTSDNLVSLRGGNFTNTVYLHDRHLNTVIAASDPPSGGTANGSSGGSTVTPDGRFVLFTS